MEHELAGDLTVELTRKSLCRPFCHCCSDVEDSDEEGDGSHPPITMAGVSPPPAGPECLVQAVLMEVLVILVSSGDKQADRAVVEAVWELLHEFDAMCRLLSNIRSPCLPLAKASMQLLTKMHHSKRFSIGPRSVLQVEVARVLQGGGRGRKGDIVCYYSWIVVSWRSSP